REFSQFGQRNFGRSSSSQFRCPLRWVGRPARSLKGEKRFPRAIARIAFQGGAESTNLSRSATLVIDLDALRGLRIRLKKSPPAAWEAAGAQPQKTASHETVSPSHGVPSRGNI